MRLASSAARDSGTNANTPSCAEIPAAVPTLVVDLQCLLKIHSEPATMLLPRVSNVSVAPRGP